MVICFINRSIQLCVFVQGKIIASTPVVPRRLVGHCAVLLLGYWPRLPPASHPESSCGEVKDFSLDGGETVLLVIMAIILCTPHSETNSS